MSRLRSPHPQAASRPVDYSTHPRATTTPRPTASTPYNRGPRGARALPQPADPNVPASHVAPRHHPPHTTLPSRHQEEIGPQPEHHPPHFRSVNISVVHFFELVPSPHAHARARARSLAHGLPARPRARASHLQRLNNTRPCILHTRYPYPHTYIPLPTISTRRVGVLDPSPSNIHESSRDTRCPHGKNTPDFIPGDTPDDR